MPVRTLMKMGDRQTDRQKYQPTNQPTEMNEITCLAGGWVKETNTHLHIENKVGPTDRPTNRTY